MRLQVYLSHNGICSRRKAMELIQQGLVQVNNQVIKEPSWDVNADQDKVIVKGRLVEIKSYQYVLLNKPSGYVTTTTKKHREQTVMELLPPNLRHLSPVGRLDKNTEGLLLLTNDGSVAFQLTHPKFEVDKEYHVKIGGILKPEQKSKLEKGVLIKADPKDNEPSYTSAPAKIKDLKLIDGKSEFTMTIHEGKKRQVRRMLESVGHHVVYLQRFIQGPLKLESLKIGQWRLLSEAEITSLKKIKV